MMVALSAHITASPRYARSANLERDATRAEPLDGYVVTSRALDVIERIALVASSEPAGGAWSLTGPYGSGKSSLALLVDAAFGKSSGSRDVALDIVGSASPSAARLIADAHKRHGTETGGFSSGLVTARREPLNRTILRALHAAALRRYGRLSASDFPSAASLRACLDEVATSDRNPFGPEPSALVDIAGSLASQGPLLLIVDEFGKNLEAFRDGAEGDPYLLQQLAEVAQSSAGLPIFLLTLQHLSFEDYLQDADLSRRREWAKVQGRFDDIAYVESPAQTRALVRTVFQARDAVVGESVERWSRPYAEAIRSLGIKDMSTPEGVASCYPLHPLSALVLPEMCSRYGQHERTLFSFLAGPGRSGVSAFLDSHEWAEPLPSVGLDALYDYFVSAGVGAQRTGRWAEIAVRIRDAHGLGPLEEGLIKAIAVLNLVSAGGVLRASRGVLRLIGDHVPVSLADLESRGLVTYRDYADEYRIWQGTDVDIHHHLAAARRHFDRSSLAETLSTIGAPPPVVAARHSAENETLRVFERSYASVDSSIEPLDQSSDYDGRVLLLLDDSSDLPSISPDAPSDAKPVVVVVPSDLGGLADAASEVAVATAALRSPDVSGDWVARREMGERLAQARSLFDHALAETFGDEQCRWVLLDRRGAHVELPGGRGSAPVSQAADHAYPSTPVVRNEMLNRTSLTSQGSKARRLLLEAMIAHGDRPELGLSGYGPEVAMYKSLIEGGGIHALDEDTGCMKFTAPSDESLRPAWDALMNLFGGAKARRMSLRELHRYLQSPPIGMKAAVLPVFVTAALLAHPEVAIYEHGTFQPFLTAELSQRMVRNPTHFEIKHFASERGPRRQVIDEMMPHFAIGGWPRSKARRAGGVLDVVGGLINRIRDLDNYTRRTDNLTPSARAVRDVLLGAVEPDDLLFSDLPAALGFAPVPVGTGTYAQAPDYIRSLRSAINEVEHSFPRLLDQLLHILLSASAEESRHAISGQAAALTNEVLDPGVRAFVLALSNRHIEDDTDWIKAIATVVARKAPAEWRDDDLRLFEGELPQRVASFRRLIALHAERRSSGGGPFDALRVTFTSPDGREDVRLVSIDQDERHRVRHGIDALVESLSGVTGSPTRTEHAILALLGERLLPRSSTEVMNADMTERRVVGHG